MTSLVNNNLFLIVIDGPMGSGKSTASKLLNQQLEGTARVALEDVKRFISGHEKDHAYNKISQEVILVMADEYLKSGISVIIEWAMRKERAEAFKEIAKKYSAKCFIYQLYAPKDLLLQRVKERTKVLINQPQLPAENIKNIEENFEMNYAFRVDHSYGEAIVLNSEEMNSEQIVARIMKDVRN